MALLALGACAACAGVARSPAVVRRSPPPRSAHSCSPGSLADEGYAAGPGLMPERRAACSASWPRRLSSAAPRPVPARGRGRAGSFMELIADARRAVAGRARGAGPAGLLLALAFCAWVLIARRRRSQQKYEGLRILQVNAKLVLVVVDALKPAMLERAADEGKAPVFAEILRRGTLLPGLRERLPSVTPAASASITTGTTWIATACPRSTGTTAASAATSTTGPPARRCAPSACCATITDIVYNMNFDHLSRAHADVLRAARRRRRANRLHAIPDLPRPHAARARGSRGGCAVSRRQRTSATPSTGRPSSSTASCMRPSTVDCRPTLARPGTRDPYSGCVGAYLERVRPVRLHAVLAARQRPLLASPRPGCDRHVDRPGRPLPASSWSRRGAGWSRSSSDHAVILMADHAQIAVEQRIRLADALSRMAGAACRTTRTPARRAGRLPGCALGDGLPARRRGPADGAAQARAGPAGEARGHRRDRLDARMAKRASGPAAAELRFAPGVGMTDMRGGRWDIDGISRGVGGRGRRGRARTAAPIPTLSGGSGPHSRAMAPATCCCPRSAGTSSWTGAAPITSVAVAMGRCAGATRWRRWPSSIAARTSTATRPGGSGRSPTSPRSCWITSACERRDPRAGAIVQGRVQGVFFRDTLRLAGRPGRCLGMGAELCRRLPGGALRGGAGCG